MPATTNPWLLLISILFTGLTSIGIKEIVVAFLKRRPKPAAAVVEVKNQIQLADAIQKYAEKVEKDAEQYRDSARQAWLAVDEANRKVVRAYQKLDESTRRFEEAARYLDAVVAKVFDPSSDIESVRAYIQSRPIPFSRAGGSDE